MTSPNLPGRRTFLGTSLAAGAALALSGHAALTRPALARPRPATKGLRILILGGTGFLGPHCTDSALARGHSVTLFNRGRTEDRRRRAGRPSAVPTGVEVLYGNRDPNKTADSDDNAQQGDTPVDGSPKGLSQLEGKSWDAVIDTSGYWPRMVKASAELLAPRVKQYVFISTISVYKKTDTPGMDETAELGTLSDPATEDFGADFSNYGPGKAACEAAAEAAMPGRATIIRPGYIVGPRDTSARFIYWPLRLRRGGETIVPGSPDDPIQLIDVRDLADFTIACIEAATMGVYNATGPASELSMRSFVDQVKQGAGGEPSSPTFVGVDFLEKQGVGLGQFPLHAPPSGETAGFHRVSIKRALDKGLKFRPLPDTTKATLAWFDELPKDTQTAISRSAITPEREAELLAAWKAAKP